MLIRRLRRRPAVRGLGISLLIFSVVHTPLPQPDFHNIRHHDAPGEVCGYHDHLLRWHPNAGAAEDVAVLHWHWFVPATEPSDPPGRSDGPALHAHSPDWQVSTWDSGPQISPDSSSRFLGRHAHCSLSPLWLTAPEVGLASLPVPDSHPPLAFSATFAPRVSLASLFQRWVC